MNSVCDRCGYKAKSFFDEKIYEHKCGDESITLCTSCEPKVEIDMSPMTLLRLFSPGVRFAPAVMATTYKCKKCMDGKTVRDIQYERYLEKYGEGI